MCLQTADLLDGMSDPDRRAENRGWGLAGIEELSIGKLIVDELVVKREAVSCGKSAVRGREKTHPNCIRMEHQAVSLVEPDLI